MTPNLAQGLRDFARNAFPITYFKHPPRAATWNPELCRFFEEVQASLLIDGHLREAPAGSPDDLRARAMAPTAAEMIAMRAYLREQRTETALRTKAPARVGSSRCDSTPKHKKPRANKPAPKKTKRATRKVPA